jgi:serine/threonine-protein kinase RsbT
MQQALRSWPDGLEALTEPGVDRNAGGVVRVRSASDVVDACDLARQVARSVGFNALDQTKIVTTASELARNIVLYAGDGEVRISTIEGPRRGVQIVAADSGPGIADIERVMSSGYRSRTGMGMGLKGAKRLMDQLEIESRPGAGTTVVARKHVS